MVGNVDKIEQAYLFGQVGKSLYEKGGENFILSIEDEEPQRCRAGEIGLLSDVTSEYSIAYDITEEELRKRLRNLYYAYKALSFSLNGLDPAMVNSRVSVIQTANKLCHKDDRIYDFVRNRLLGYPFPLRDEKEANEAIKNAIDEAVKADRVKAIYEELGKNRKTLQTFHEVWMKVVPMLAELPEFRPFAETIKNAIDEAVEADRVKAIYEELGKNRKTLQVFHNVWKSVVPEVFTEETEQARALRFFVDRGVVRELVTTADFQLKVNELKQRIVETRTELEDVVELLPDRLTRLFMKLVENFPGKPPDVIVFNAQQVEIEKEIKDVLDPCGISYTVCPTRSSSPAVRPNMYLKMISPFIKKVIIRCDNNTPKGRIFEQLSQLSKMNWVQQIPIILWAGQLQHKPQEALLNELQIPKRLHEFILVCTSLQDCLALS